MFIQWAYQRDSLSRYLELVLKKVSRLDAFSGSLILTWLPGGATGVTTGTLEVKQ